MALTGVSGSEQISNTLKRMAATAGGEIQVSRQEEAIIGGTTRSIANNGIF